MPEKQDFEKHMSSAVDKLEDELGEKFADVREMKDIELRYFDTLKVLQDDKDFTSYCKVFKVPVRSERWIAATVIDGGRIPQTVRCKLLGIKYNQKDYRRVRDYPRNEPLLEIATMAYQAYKLDNSQKDVSMKMMLDELALIIQTAGRDSDKVKAIESYIKLKEKIEGARAVKPWHAVWNKIRFSILAKPNYDKDLQQSPV